MKFSFLLTIVFIVLFSCDLATAENVAEHQKSKPGVINCEVLSWIESCDELNETFRQNPSAPIRFWDPSGQEHIYAPGTPSTFITMQLNPTDENFEAHAQHIEADNKLLITSHIMWNDYLIRRGGLKVDFTGVNSVAEVIPSLLKVRLFLTDSSSDALQQIRNLGRVKKEYPALPATVYSFNEGARKIAKLSEKYNLPYRLLSADEQKKLLSQGHKFPLSTISTDAARHVLEESITKDTYIDAMRKMSTHALSQMKRKRGY